jgi:hypothetical protein
MSGVDDRELQDRIIRYLTDADQRTQSSEVGLTAQEAEKAQRFSKFLSRRYYRDRLARAFRYSKIVIESLQEPPPGSNSLFADDAVDTTAFDEFLPHCILGSLASARAVGGLAIAQLKALAIAPWWDDLLSYEFAFFVQLATSESSPTTAQLRISASTMLQTFEWAMPELMARLKSGAVVTEELRKTVTLLFSRTHHGRIYVVELDERARAVVNAIDGSRTAPEVAAASASSIEDTISLLATLREIGAVQ